MIIVFMGSIITGHDDDDNYMILVMVMIKVIMTAKITWMRLTVMIIILMARDD